MSNKLFELANSLPMTSEYVFSTPQGNPFNRGQLTRLISKYHKTFPKNKKWSCHTFRHSFAYNYLRDGGQMYQLQAILGHKTIGLTVNLYGAITAEDVEKASPYDF